MKIPQCPMCGCTKVPPVELEVEVHSKEIKSVKVNGAKCSQCGEEFYSQDTMRAIEEIENGSQQQAVGA